jgi:hypothetical protein
MTDYHMKGGRPFIDFLKPHAQLMTVTDERYGTVFPPPNEHLGQPLASNLPYDVAKLWIHYLGNLLDECDARTT